MAEMDKAHEAQDKNQHPLLSGRVKPETKERFEAYKAWLKAEGGGEITYDDVFKNLLDNSAAAEWGTTHPQVAHYMAHAQCLLSRVRAEFVAIADQVEVAEAEAEEKVRKQLDALSETVSAQKRELDGEDGKPGLRKRAAERDALAAELEVARAQLADAHRGLVQLQNEHRKTEEQLAAARAEVEELKKQIRRSVQRIGEPER